MTDTHNEAASVLDLLIHKGLFKKKVTSSKVLYRKVYTILGVLQCFFPCFHGARNPGAKERLPGWIVNG